MRNRILIGLCLVAVAGIVYVVTRGGPKAPAPDDPVTVTPPTESPGPPPATTPVSEFDRTVSKTPPPQAKQDTPATAPGTPKPDPRLSRIDGKVYMNDVVSIARRMHSEDTNPMDDVSAVGTALHYYRLVYKENPVGSLNEEIIAQLIGNNPKSIVVIPPDHPDINAKGELVDRWGTPYFFHGLTRTDMDVWSAGPDLKLGTPDDVKLGVDAGFGEQLGLTIDP